VSLMLVPQHTVPLAHCVLLVHSTGVAPSPEQFPKLGLHMSMSSPSGTLYATQQTGEGILQMTPLPPHTTGVSRLVASAGPASFDAASTESVGTPVVSSAPASSGKKPTLSEPASWYKSVPILPPHAEARPIDARRQAACILLNKKTSSI
jgi:hypothetical protein